MMSCWCKLLKSKSPPKKSHLKKIFYLKKKPHSTILFSIPRISLVLWAKTVSSALALQVQFQDCKGEKTFKVRLIIAVRHGESWRFLNLRGFGELQIKLLGEFSVLVTISNYKTQQSVKGHIECPLWKDDHPKSNLQKECACE